MDKIKEKFAEKALPMTGEIKNMLKSHGDTVMGDDSQERNVLSIHQVNSPGYQISYNNLQ